MRRICLQDKKLSIIVPIYNVENYLERCMNSIIAIKNFKYITVILVDDGSTDESGLIADEYAKRFDNICVYHKVNGGLSDARNYGLLRAETEYVFFIDSDDMLVPETFDLAINELEQRAFQVLLFDAKVVDEKDCYLETVDCNYYVHGGLQPNCCYTGKDVIELQLTDHNDFVTTVWLGIYNRNFLIQNNLWFEKGLLHEDELWTIKTLLNANEIRYLVESVYLYRQRVGSIMSSSNRNWNKNIQAIVYIYQSLYAYVDWKVSDIEFSKMLKGNISRRYVHALSRFDVYKYRETYKKIQFHLLYKNCTRPIDKIRVLMLKFMPNMFSWITKLIGKSK